jgi:hypothetical protein
MYVVRDIMHCQPGKVRPLVEKFVKMGDLVAGLGYARPRVMTDVSGTRFWTTIAEFDVESVAAFFDMESKLFADPAAGEIMSGYHDLVDEGRREIYKLAE